VGKAYGDVKRVSPYYLVSVGGGVHAGRYEGVGPFDDELGARESEESADVDVLGECILGNERHGGH